MIDQEEPRKVEEVESISSASPKLKEGEKGCLGEVFLPISKNVNGVIYSLRWRREKNKQPCLNMRKGSAQILQLPGWASCQSRGVEWCLEMLDKIGGTVTEAQLPMEKALFLKDP